jgi:hypothetical protein
MYRRSLALFYAKLRIEFKKAGLKGTYLHISSACKWYLLYVVYWFGTLNFQSSRHFLLMYVLSAVFQFGGACIRTYWFMWCVVGVVCPPWSR